MPVATDAFTEIREAGGELYLSYLLAGFREHIQNEVFKSTPYLLQKRVRDGHGNTRYFINVWCYDNRRYTPERPFGAQAEVQFCDDNDEPTCNVTMLGGPHEPDRVERYFDRFHGSNGFGFCERAGE